MKQEPFIDIPKNQVYRKLIIEGNLYKGVFVLIFNSIIGFIIREWGGWGGLGWVVKGW